MSENFKLIIIGSGTMMPTKHYHPSCYLLEIADKKILLDIGHTSLARLIDLKINLHNIDILFISHFHTDHFSDAFALIHARWVDDIQNKNSHKPLTIIGPKTIKNRLKKLKEVFWPEPKEDYPVKIIEGPRQVQIRPHNTNLKEIKIDTFDIKHVPWFKSLGIKVTYKEKTFIYTGDIGSNHPQKSLIQKVKNANVLLIECGTLHPSPNHFTPEQIIELSKKSGAKKIIATHLREKNISIIKEKFRKHKNILVAKDLMNIKI